jgi:peptidoglycan/LPS O-acetylase OafA/YrhL
MSEHVLNLGVFGVELFFVLSGFLIGGILIKTFVNAEKFTFSDVGNFWLRRWFRTLPNYWLILTACFVLLHFMKIELFEAADIKGYFFLQNLRHPNMLNAFPEGWSLSVEEWFYLTLPVVMYVCASVFKVTNKSAFLLRVFAGYLFVFVAIRFFNAFDPYNGRDPDEGIRKVVVFRLDAVMYGVLFGWLNYFKPQLLGRIKGQLLITCLVGFSIIFYLCLHYRLQFLPEEPPGILFARNAFLYMVVPLSLSLCLPYANSVKTISSNMLSKTIQHISKISYSMYLVHYTLVFRPFFMPHKIGSFTTALIYYLLYWTIVVILSSVLYKYFEYPVMNLRDRLKPKRAHLDAQ